MRSAQYISTYLHISAGFIRGILKKSASSLSMHDDRDEQSFVNAHIN